MEFMDRRGRSLLVQFWLTVESFKNPLEMVDSDSSGEDYEPLSDPASAATLKGDLNMINDLYFAGSAVPPVLSSIPDKYVNAIQDYATKGSTSSDLERKARRSVMLAQRQVEREMDQDFESFKRSDLWFRAVGDLRPKRVHEGPTVRPGPFPREQATSSTSLFASLVHGLAPEASRSQSHLGSGGPARADSSLSLSSGRYPAPRIGKSRFSVDSGRPSAVSTPGPSRVASSQAQTSGNLEILMSSASDAIEDSPTRAPLFDETEDGQLLSADAEEAQRMAAIQAAVTDIIASEGRMDVEPARPSGSGDSLARAKDDYDVARRPRHRPIFADVQPVMPSTVADDQVLDEDDDRSEALHVAAPGDLQLPHEIARLEDKIRNNQSQDAVLDTLIRKAELTGDAQELRVLKKSKSSLERETRQLVFQKTQYEQQDSASKLIAGKTRAVIVNSTSGEEDGKQVIRYLIEVQQPASGWVVARRYSEFLQMHQRLKERYAMVKGLEFPGKHLVTSLSTQMLDTRRIALEKYLQVSPTSIIYVRNELSSISKESSDDTCCMRKPRITCISVSRFAFHRKVARRVGSKRSSWLPRTEHRPQCVSVLYREHRRRVLWPIYARCYDRSIDAPSGRVRRDCRYGCE